MGSCDDAAFYYERFLPAAREKLWLYLPYIRSLKCSRNRRNHRWSVILTEIEDAANVSCSSESKCEFNGLCPATIPGGTSTLLAMAMIAEEAQYFVRAYGYYRILNDFNSRKFRPYMMSRDNKEIESAMQTFSSDFLFKFTTIVGFTSTLPVFIVGLPYLGSKELEILLDKHGKIFGMNANGTYFEAVKEMMRERLRQGLFGSYSNAIIHSIFNSDYKAVESMAQGMVTEMRKISRYITGAGEGQILHYIDTELSNFKLVGLIHCVFPNAVIINMVRDPLDTLMDCYRDVDGHASSDTWRLSFPSMISYYTNYLRLMGHWRRVLPDRVIDLNADLLREDPRRALAPVLDALGLRWEKEMNAIDLSLSSLSVPGHWRRFSPMVDELVRPLSQSLAEVGKVYPLPFADEINWSLTPTHRLYKDLVRPVHSAVEGSGPEKKKKGGQSPPPVPTTKRMPAPLASPINPEVEELYTATIAPAEVQSLRTLSAQLPFLTGDTKVIRWGGGWVSSALALSVVSCARSRCTSDSTVQLI